MDLLGKGRMKVPVPPQRRDTFFCSFNRSKQHESVPAFAVSHVSSKRTDAAHFAKRRGHRQELVLREVRGKSIDIHIGGPPVGIHGDIGIASGVGVGVQLSLASGDGILEGRTVRIWVEEEGSARLGIGLSVQINVGEWDGWVSGRCRERR